jgi:hypothetical protein
MHDSGMFSHLGETQIDEIIRASPEALVASFTEL